MSMIEHIPTAADHAARRARMGWPQPKPVVIQPPSYLTQVVPTSVKGERAPAVRHARKQHADAVRAAIMTLTEINAPDGYTTLQRISEATKVSIVDLRSENRAAPILLARQFACWFLVRRRGYSTHKAARLLDCSHKSVLQGTAKVEEMMAGGAHD
jgi:hypothetical protein